MPRGPLDAPPGTQTAQRGCCLSFPHLFSLPSVQHRERAAPSGRRPLAASARRRLPPFSVSRALAALPREQSLPNTSASSLCFHSERLHALLGRSPRRTSPPSGRPTQSRLLLLFIVPGGRRRPAPLLACVASRNGRQISVAGHTLSFSSFQPSSASSPRVRAGTGRFRWQRASRVVWDGGGEEGLKICIKQKRYKLNRYDGRCEVLCDLVGG
jgi:hypothetical protein